MLSIHSVSFCMQGPAAEGAITSSCIIETYNAERDDFDLERIIEALEDDLETNWWTCKRFRLASDSRNFVARHEGRTIGFVSLWDSQIRPGVQTGNSHIELLAVALGCQRKGYGRQLLRHALNYLQELSMTPVTIHVFSKNTKAKNLYESQGFEFSGNYASSGTILPIYIKMLQEKTVDI